MNTQPRSNPSLEIIATLLVISFLLSACAFTTITEQPPQPAATNVPVATTQPQATPAAKVEASPTAEAALPYTVDSAGLATSIQMETVAAVPASDNAPYWEVLPAYTRLTLQGYPVSKHMLQPQIFIYPVKELEQANQGAAKIVASLQALIASPKEIADMPFLPLLNAGQVMHTQIQYLDFKNGHGLRYLTQFDQGIMPINNYELIYTYQGLTNDGKYYVAAVLPVTHPSLPADDKITGKEPQDFTNDFPRYLSTLTNTLNTQAADTFTPDLTKLDAMFSSLEIR
jgi:hypothetical protein